MNVQEINKKLITGFLSLSFRQAVLLGVNFLTINIILARVLPVEVIGIFNIGNTILGLFTFFSDLGLAAALIQKKEITQKDISSTFLIQELLAVIITVIIFISAPVFVKNLDASAIWLIRGLAVSFLLTSLKVIPSLLLERNLKFGPIVWVDLIEASVYNFALIFFSFRGFLVDAFTYSAILRSVVGVVAIYLIAPWKPTLSFSKESLKGLLTFGVPFQLNSILALIKDRLVALIVANIVGPLGFGYITWAQNLALLPLLLMQNIIRITFPAFSRLQHDRVSLKKTLERSIFLTTLITYPLIFGLVAVASAMIEYVVTSKWQPALPLIYLFSINTFWATLSTTFTNTLNAIGKIKLTLYLMIMWTVLTWLLSPVLAIKYGFIGVGIASAIISLTSLAPIIIVKRILKVEIIKNILDPLIGSIFMGIIVYFIASEFARDFSSTIVVIVLGGMVYILTITLISYKKVIKHLKGMDDEID